MKTARPGIEPLESRIAPAIFTVTTVSDTTDNAHDTGSLRDALALADAHAGKDTILFHLPTPPAHGGSILKLMLGKLTSTGNVTIKGLGAGQLIIDGGGASGIFYFTDNEGASDSPVTISGLSIMHGQASDGAGIESAESLTLKNVVIADNTATTGYGGGVNITGNTSQTKIKIINSLITSNFAGSGGGGMDLNDLKSLVLKNTIISGNSCSNAGAIGGGLDAEVGNKGGVTITNCLILGNRSAIGGGLWVSDIDAGAQKQIALSQTTISGNVSDDTSGGRGGGGVYVYAGKTVFTGCTVSNNTAVYDGGGIFAQSSLTISSSKVSGNSTTAKNGAEQGGGGVFVRGSGSGASLPVEITGSHFTDNRSAGDGAGLLARTGLGVTISSSVFSGNHATGSGGGIFTEGSGANQGVDLTVSGGTFSNNSANLANGYGGGIHASGAGKFSIIASKVTGNVANIGGGIYAQSSVAEKGVVIKNVVATDNFADAYGGGMTINNSPSFQINGGSITGNDSGDGGGGVYALNAGGKILGVTISGNTTLSSGGGVAHFGTGLVSVQISKVTGNTAPSNANTYGTATHGTIPVPRAGHGTILVTTVSDNNDTGSLRNALALADADPSKHDTIAFALPTGDFVDGAWTIHLNGTELTSLGNVSIVGPGKGKLIIDGGGMSRVFDIDDQKAATDRPTTISGLSIINGQTNAHGGGIYSAESLTLKNVVISGNTSGGGGGLEMNQLGAGTEAKISGCLISDNTTTGYAGGADLFDLKAITISKTVITGNTATLSAGGLNAQVDATAGTGISITGCQISGNTATYGAGLTVADHNDKSKTTISASTISGNTANGTSAAHGGGGIYVQSGQTVITGAKIINNTAVYKGGGLDAQGFASVTISKSTLSGNGTTTLAAQSGGGGLFIEGNAATPFLPVQIISSHIDDNRSAGYGGGLFAHQGLDLTISGSTFSGNHSTRFGGGIFTFGGAGGNVDLTLNGGALSNNNAGDSGGGGMVADSAGVVSITGAKVMGNSASGTGGLEIDGATSVNLTNLVVTDNVSQLAGGGLEITGTTDFHITGGSIHGNATFAVGGGIALGNSSGSIMGVVITGNVASTGGGVFNGGQTPGNVILQIAKVIANNALTGPNVDDTPGDLSTFTFA